MKRSKLYRERCKALDGKPEGGYQLKDAIAALKKMPTAKFDETVELALRLGIDPRQSDQMVRGALVLPKGTGKSVRVVVIAAGDAGQAARDAGADAVGTDDLIEKIQGGWLDFDVLIATPDAMQKLRTLGKVLGPRGLMPNPKTGTVTNDTGAAVRQAKAGRIEYRSDRGGCVHVPVGKTSFPAADLEVNIDAVFQTIQRVRPASVKGSFVLGAFMSSTMSPGIRINLKDIVKV